MKSVSSFLLILPFHFSIMIWCKKPQKKVLSFLHLCTSGLSVISPPGSFATNQLDTKILILSINTEVDNKRAT